jgi:hypothetical protein
MNTASFVATQQVAEAPPDLKARVAGVCYVLAVLTAISGEAFLRGGLGFEVGLIAISGMIAVALLLYDLLKPVNASLALLGTSFSLVGLGFEGARWNPWGVDIAVVLHGAYCLLVSYLVFRSAFLPRILGVLMALAGLGWLTFVSPLLANYLAPYNLAAGFIGEGSLMLYLLVMGVHLERWIEQTGAAGK